MNGPDDKEPPLTPVEAQPDEEKLAGRERLGVSPLESLASRTMHPGATGAIPALSGTLTGVVLPIDDAEGLDTGEHPADHPSLRQAQTFWPDERAQEVSFVSEGPEAQYPVHSLLPALFVNTAAANDIPLRELEMILGEEDILQIYDIAGSTTADRRLGKTRPEFLETHFKPIHQIITECILRYGGDILTFEGDCQVAVFQTANETGRTNANYEISQKVGAYCRELSEMLPAGETVGLRCISVSGEGMRMHTEKGIGTVLDEKYSVISRERAEKSVKQEEGNLPEEKRIGAYFYAVTGPNGTLIHQESYDRKPPPYTGKPTAIRLLGDPSQLNPADITNDIIGAIDPPSAEERLALSRTSRNVGAAVYLEFIGDTDTMQLRMLREAVAREFESFGGYVDKAMGNGMLITFGAGFDIGQEDVLERAVRASMRVKTSLDTSSREAFWGMSAAIGISDLNITGRLTLGTKERRETTTIGGPANIGARMKSVAKRRCEESRETMVVIGMPSGGISHFCNAVETVERTVRGIGEMRISQIMSVKPPQKTSIYKKDDGAPSLVQGQEAAFAEFKKTAESCPVTIISGTNTVAQEIFARNLLEESDILYSLKTESVDRYTEYGSLYDLLNELEKHTLWRKAAQSKPPKDLKRLLMGASGKTGSEKVSVHKKIVNLFAEILKTLNLTVHGTLYLCVLEADLMDAKSREVMEEVMGMDDCDAKLILAGKDLEGTNVEAGMDEVTVEGAKQIASFILKSRTGASAEPMDEGEMNRLIAPLVSRDDADSERTVNITSINIYLRALITRGDLVQKGDKWEIRENAVLTYSKTEIFKEMVGPLVRRLGSNGRRLENLALCFGVTPEFLSHRDIPDGIVGNENEFEEFARLLAQKGIIKKAPQIEESKGARLFSNDSYELEPRLREAAEECLEASRELKGQVHYAIAAKYNPRAFETTTEMTPEEKRNALAKRAHFLDHARMHFGYAEIDEENVQLFLDYIRVLKTVTTEDFDIRQEDPFLRLLQHDIKRLAGIGLVKKGFANPNDNTFATAKYELIELLGLFNTAIYRTRSNVDVRWLREHSGLADWREHLHVEENAAVNIDAILSLMKVRTIIRKIEDLSGKIISSASAESAALIDTSEGVTEEMRTLIVEVDYLTEKFLNQPITGTRVLTRLVGFLDTATGVYIQYAKTLQRLGKRESLSTEKEYIEKALKLTKLTIEIAEGIARNPEDITNVVRENIRKLTMSNDSTPSYREFLYDTNRPLEVIGGKLKMASLFNDGVAILTLARVGFFDLLPWIRRHGAEDTEKSVQEESIALQMTNIMREMELALNLGPDLTSNTYAFDPSQDIASEPERDGNFLSVIRRMEELVDIKANRLRSGEKRRHPKTVITPLIQVTEVSKILGRCIYMAAYDTPKDSDIYQTAKRKYLNLLEKGRRIGPLVSEINGFMDEGSNAIQEFIARFNTVEIDLDFAAISDTPEGKVLAQTRFDESMARMRELYDRCDKGDGNDVMCSFFNMTQDIKKLYTWAALVGLKVPEGSFDEQALHTLTTDMAAVTAGESGYDLEIIDDPE